MRKDGKSCLAPRRLKSALSNWYQIIGIQRRSDPVTPAGVHVRIRYYTKASAAEMCAIQFQEKSGVFKKNPRILKKNTALLVVDYYHVRPVCRVWFRNFFRLPVNEFLQILLDVLICWHLEIYHVEAKVPGKSWSPFAVL